MPNVNDFSLKNKTSENNSVSEDSPPVKLKETFRKNGLPYQLVQRNEVAVVYGVGGTYTNNILHYEVCQIYFRKAGIFKGKTFPASEVLPSNEVFGRDLSRAIVNRKEALDYFNELTNILIIRREGKNNTTCGIVNRKKVSTYHPKGDMLPVTCKTHKL